ncbi:MAG: DeoR/GlpR transcriptional regulator [Chloroflexi bacterium]|jgi:DeoR/GlpR family transcriptional regulator of sugar metabolism|uniref:DeoR/GlpR family DNA-binding transcription regulator n=1 Tax=Candidatus Roseilinea sp. NK_OTU-006 TaxID=2704250 RepID=UPI000F1FB4E0|nr:DeoR/GlpR family DNA-binding transcription regulator [Candidatus Roseilinea sp. NK_OTU-006]RMG65838.1 MAG: DeoR/GlpR transcriptional regulator [Chloroflexota bacterium]
MHSVLSSPERQNQILQLLARNQRITVAEVCETFEVSEATARRDLEALAEQGKLQRVHGGAIALREAPPEAPILQREREQAAEKIRIGLAAAALVQDGETVFLGSGSTVLEAARALRTKESLTVITNSLPVINTLAGLPNITLICLGGQLRKSELSFIGHITEQALTEVRADKVLLGIRAISLDHGLTNDYLAETMTDRAILRVGREVILLADHTKLGRVAPAFVAPVESIHTLVTNSAAPSDFLEALRERGIRLIVA